MQFTKSYAQDPGYFKELIRRINEGADFMGYLIANGYEPIKKSAGSVEFSKDAERIVVNTKREPVTYFNRNDSEDNGRFFKFINRRTGNFYQAVSTGMELLGQPIIEVPKPIKQKKEAPKESLEDKYNVISLAKDAYLVDKRGIGRRTLKSRHFKDRVFNAVHKRDDLGKIFNIAIPKYGLDGQVKNYTLYNQPFYNRKAAQVNKFRLVLNQSYQYLFTSNPDMDAKRVVLCESAIDAMSHYELTKGKENFYIALDGELDPKKLEQLDAWMDKVDSSGRKTLVMAFDNDSTGHRYDIKILEHLANTRYGEGTMAAVWKKPELTLNIKDVAGNITSPNALDRLQSITDDLGEGCGMVRYKDHMQLQLDMETCLKPDNKPHWDKMVQKLGEHTLQRYVQTQRPHQANDWNELLMAKKGRAVELGLSDIDKVLPRLDVFVYAFANNLPAHTGDQARVLAHKGDQLLLDVGGRQPMVLPVNQAKAFVGLKKKRHN